MDGNCLLRSVVALSLVAAISYAPAGAQEICPLRLPADVLKPHHVPVGWKALIMKGTPLRSAGMLQGVYDSGAYLVPRTTTVKKRGSSAIFTSTWEFGPPGEKWLHCGYGGALELYKSIGEDIAECTITTTRRGGIIEAITVKCS